jgi:hypothetical protein
LQLGARRRSVAPLVTLGIEPTPKKVCGKRCGKERLSWTSRRHKSDALRMNPACACHDVHERPVDLERFAGYPCSVITVRAHVRNGRLIVDEPTDLPDGTEIDLVADDVAAWLRAAPPTDEPLSAEQIEQLRAIRSRGDYVSHEDVRTKVRARQR